MTVSRKDRAFELDALRGLSIFMMICHHLIWDIRYLLGYSDLFKFEKGYFFNYVLQPLFLCCFILISGVCCTFSRNNLKRSLRLMTGALALSLIMALVSVLLLHLKFISDLSEEGLFVFFNILHLLTVGTMLCYFVEKAEFKSNRADSSPDLGLPNRHSSWTNSILIIFALALFMAEPFVSKMSQRVNTYVFLPFGVLPEQFISMGDYLPLVPWLGVFLVGMVLGRILYSGKRTLFPGAPVTLRRIARPFEWIGRHSLFVYLIHQPILLAILFAGYYAEIW